MDFVFDEEVNKLQADATKRQALMQGFTPGVHDLMRYFKNARLPQPDGTEKFMPLVGEENNVLTLFMAFAMARQPAVLRSFAGSGKTVLLDMVWSMIPADRKHEIDMTSGMGVWSEAPDINAASFLLFPETQNAADGQEVTKVLKKIGEGKQARRTRTDITDRDDDGNYGLHETVIQPKPFMTSFALENDVANEIYNDEVKRRVIELTTDISQDQTRRIVESYLRMMEVGKNGVCTMDDEEVQKIRNHVEDCMNLYDKLEGFRFPGASAMIKGVPTTFVETRSSIKVLESVMKGYALWNHKERIVKDGYLFMTPQDLYFAWTTYGQTFIYKSLKVDLMAQPIIGLFPKAVWANKELHSSSLMTATQLIQHLKSVKVGMSKKKLQMILDDLEDNGLITKHTDSMYEEDAYYKTGLGDFSEIFSYKDIAARAGEVVRVSYPDIAEDYIKRFCLDVVVKHPYRDETVPLFGEKNVQV